MASMFCPGREVEMAHLPTRHANVRTRQIYRGMVIVGLKHGRHIMAHLIYECLIDSVVTQLCIVFTSLLQEDKLLSSEDCRTEQFCCPASKAY